MLNESSHPTTSNKLDIPGLVDVIKRGVHANGHANQFMIFYENILDSKEIEDICILHNAACPSAAYVFFFFGYSQLFPHARNPCPVEPMTNIMGDVVEVEEYTGSKIKMTLSVRHYHAQSYFDSVDSSDSHSTSRNAPVLVLTMASLGVLTTLKSQNQINNHQ